VLTVSEASEKVIIETVGAWIRRSPRCTSQIEISATVSQMSRGLAFGRLSAVVELKVIRQDRWGQTRQIVEYSLKERLEIS
jgi:hypothetical protein